MQFIWRAILAAWIVVFVGSLLAAQDLTIKGGDVKIVEVDRIIVVKDKVQVVSSFPFTINAPAGGFGYVWELSATAKSNARMRKNSLEVTEAAKGTITAYVSWYVYDKTKDPPFEEKTASLTFAVGEPGPTPVPPTPVPPTPVPPVPVITAPIDLPGNAVLIIEEKGDRINLPPSQLLILNGATVRDYLNSATQVDPRRPDWKAWRQYDKDTDASGEHKAWQDAFKRPRQSLPWIIISNGKTGYEGPLPKTIDETIKLLKDYGVKP